MTRLECISSYINDDEKVIDVGCDQAILSKKLAIRGIYSIASDIKKTIVDNAIKSTKEEYLKFIDFRVGNGITLKDNEIDYTLVLSGMGSYTILNILKAYKGNLKKIITISNNNNDILRKEMLDLGYKVLVEEIIKEKNKYYNLIVFEPGYFDYSFSDLINGINHKNVALLKEKNILLYNKYKSIIDIIDDEKERIKLEKIISVLIK